MNRIVSYHRYNFGIKGTMMVMLIYLGSSNQIIGFGITATEISSSNENLILKSSGEWSSKKYQVISR